MEYLVTMTTHVPDGTPAEAVDDVRARESAHTRELAAQGHVLRLWRPPLAPGEWRTLGLFAAAGAEFLVTFTPAVPEGTSARDVEEATAREAERASELAKQGHLARLWVRPAEHGVSSALGLWRADGGDEMQAILDSLPLYPYERTRTTPLSPHPGDPAASATLRG